MEGLKHLYDSYGKKWGFYQHFNKPIIFPQVIRIKRRVSGQIWPLALAFDDKSFQVFRRSNIRLMLNSHPLENCQPSGNSVSKDPGLSWDLSSIQSNLNLHDNQQSL